ncbi:DUF805 domain-containing protein [Leifsonia sp. YAF41]|uniref:DUF805 domain-containing protein n=1 Tax=Leifsonia sp. YAF41 TaxID=3233086 RepID=UPI003F961CA5
MTQPPAPPAMSFGTAISTVFRKYAEFEGRAGRPEFWWFILFTSLVSSALGAFNFATPNGVISIGSSLASVWAIAVLLPTLAVSVRRLRDIGRRWTELFWILVPIAGLIVLIIRFCEPSKPESAASERPASN